MELERQFLELNNRRGLEIEETKGINENSKQRFNMERELWDGEKLIY